MDANLSSAWNAFVLSFIPIFVAIDILGVIPIYLGMIDQKSDDERKQVALSATLTAFLVAIGFMLLGKATFNVMGITLDDFRVAGGILLFTIATAELVGSSERRSPPPGEMGIFPIGIPMIIGPGALTTLLMQNEAHGISITLVALAANMLIVYVCLLYARFLNRVLGPAGSRAFAKIANLLMASIGVMMVRRGIEAFALGLRHH